MELLTMFPRAVDMRMLIEISRPFGPLRDSHELQSQSKAFQCFQRYDLD